MVDLPEPFATTSHSSHSKATGETYFVAHSRPVYADFQMVAYAEDCTRELRDTCRQLAMALRNLCELHDDGIIPSDGEFAEAYWDMAYKALNNIRENNK